MISRIRMRIFIPMLFLILLFPLLSWGIFSSASDWYMSRLSRQSLEEMMGQIRIVGDRLYSGDEEVSRDEEKELSREFLSQIDHPPGCRKSSWWRISPGWLRPCGWKTHFLPFPGRPGPGRKDRGCSPHLWFQISPGRFYSSTVFSLSGLLYVRRSITDGVRVFASAVRETEYDQTLVSHRAIFEAIRDKKAVEAQQAMYFHLMYNQNRYLMEQNS